MDSLSTTPSKKKTVALYAIAFCSVFIFGLYIGVNNAESLPNVPVFANNEAVTPDGVDFAPLWKVWDVLNNRYVPASGESTELVSEQDRLWGAVQGLASSLEDPYTVFLPPQELETFEADISGNFEGVGMEISIKDDVLTVIAPLKGTPAEKAGIRSGDRIFAIDGEATDRLGIDEAVSLIRGEGGTEVVLTIAREGENELLEISITRAVIEIPTIDSEMRNDGVFVISLYNFSAISPTLFQKALREFIEGGTNKLIIDLRGNPGGFLEASIEMASWFLPTGKVIVTEDSAQNTKPKVHRSKGYNVFNDSLKMVILIDEGSASASEILAGALSEHGIATLIGQNTFGKGSVQELVTITPETSLKVTIARWLTPNGNSISDGGLTPDISVERTSEDFENDRDPQLDEAVRLLLK